jgi:hypothetical protein
MKITTTHWAKNKNSHHKTTILEIFINKNLRTKKQTSSITLRFFFFKKKSSCFVSRNIEFSINLIFYVEHNKPPPLPLPPIC